MDTVKIAVVGAGIVGLSTAVNIQEKLHGVEVTIIADKFTSETTSHGAAGILRCQHLPPKVPLNRVRKWMQTSWNHYKNLYLTGDGPVIGIMPITGCHFYKDKPDIPEFATVVEEFEILDTDKCKQLTSGDYSYGFRYKTLMCESKRYLPYLMKRFRKNGGKVKKYKISSLSELAGDYDIVCNSMGYGSKEVLNDSEMIPVRGHILRVHAPWIKEFRTYNGVTSLYPGQDDVAIGVLSQRNSEDMNVHTEDTKRLWKNAIRYEPSLKHATLKEEWIGLRPCRAPLRLEPEIIHHPKGTLKIIHNYGHGAVGIFLSWGTAVEATHILKEHFLQTPQQKNTVSQISEKSSLLLTSKL